VRVAVVTGANRGIGLEVVRQLARDGYLAILGARDADKGAAAAEQLRGEGLDVEPRQLDVSDPESVAAFGAALERDHDRLDVLVNNAAIAGRHSKPLVETEVADFDAVMAVNLRGAFVLSRAAVRQMLPQSPRDEVRGRIVNITSQHGLVGAPGHFSYAVSKGGLIQMTRQIAVEHGADGILCNSVSPGKIVTGTPGDLSADEAGLAYVQSRTPFFRLGRAEDVAAAVAYMASEASYTSGANLMVDGGWMAY
jgi:NAD(P)-dependent dehydrogenase (short-subunit alcohol dehydrogenase family)